MGYLSRLHAPRTGPCMHRAICLTALLSLSLLLPRAGRSHDWRLRPSLRTEAEWALGTGEGRSQKLALLLEPELEAVLPGDLDLHFVGRARADAFDRLDPGNPEPPEVSPYGRRRRAGDHVAFDLRELTLSRAFGPVYVVAGKQHIVWGRADGLKVLDRVEPQDFREFILDDFEDSRRTRWALDAELALGRVTLQAVWLPDPSFHHLPGPGSPFFIDTPLLFPRVVPGVEVRDVDRPRRFLEDSDAGLRASAFLGGWDLSLVYLYQYDPLAIPFLVPSATSPTGLAVEPGYERTHVVGGSFSNAFGELTVRGEVSFQNERFLYTTRPLSRDPDGVAKTRELQAVLGLDWFGVRETFLSAQIFPSVFLKNAGAFYRDRAEWVATFFARRDFLHDQLFAELTWLVSLNHGDGLVRPEIRYEVRDGLEVWLGADVFHGTSRGLFGEFDGADRVVAGVEWSI
jgi:hypothetical protein